MEKLVVSMFAFCVVVICVLTWVICEIKNRLQDINNHVAASKDRLINGEMLLQILADRKDRKNGKVG